MFGTFFLSVISLKRPRFFGTSQRLSDQLPVVHSLSIMPKTAHELIAREVKNSTREMTVWRE